MANALIRARLQRVWVEENGDKDAKKPPRPKAELLKEIKRLQRELLQAGISSTKRRRRMAELAAANDELMAWDEDNVVQVTLSYPRSGESTITAFRQVALGDGEAHGVTLDPDFFKSVLFKEEIQGETELSVVIQDKDVTNPVLRFLRGLAATVFGKIAGGLLEGITHVVASSAAGEVSEQVKSAIKHGDNERVHAIAESRKVRLQVGNGGNLQVSNLGEGDTFQHGVLTLNLTAPRKVGKVKPDENNGQVILLLDAEAI